PSDKGNSDSSKTNPNWTDQFEQMFPIRIDSIELLEGTIKMTRLDAEPPVTLNLKKLQLDVTNLTNRERLSDSLLASVAAKGVLDAGGKLTLNMKINPTSEKYNFDLNAKLLQVPLPNYNPFFREYGNLDFESGTLDLVTEATVRNNHLEGYVKPLVTHLSVF